MAILRYTLLRLLILVVTGALLWLLGLRGPLLLLAAVMLSGLVSIFALNRSRDQVSMSLTGRLGEIRSRLAERAQAEDAWDDAARAEAHPEPPAERGPREQSPD